MRGDSLLVPLLTAKPDIKITINVVKSIEEKAVAEADSEKGFFLLPESLGKIVLDYSDLNVAGAYAMQPNGEQFLSAYVKNDPEILNKFLGMTFLDQLESFKEKGLVSAVLEERNNLQKQHDGRLLKKSNYLHLTTCLLWLGALSGITFLIYMGINRIQTKNEYSNTQHDLLQQFETNCPNILSELCYPYSDNPINCLYEYQCQSNQFVNDCNVGDGCEYMGAHIQACNPNNTIPWMNYINACNIINSSGGGGWIIAAGAIALVVLALVHYYCVLPRIRRLDDIGCQAVKMDQAFSDKYFKESRLNQLFFKRYLLESKEVDLRYPQAAHILDEKLSSYTEEKEQYLPSTEVPETKRPTQALDNETLPCGLFKALAESKAQQESGKNIGEVAKDHETSDGFNRN